MKKVLIFGCCAASFAAATAVSAKTTPYAWVSNTMIADQRARLSELTRGKGFGPQSPRNIDAKAGNNPIVYGQAPDYQQMNLCNIHFHAGAEHAGGEFTRYLGNGDGQGYNSGYGYSGLLSPKETRPIAGAICPSKHGSLKPGDTIEVHYVHSTAQVSPGPTLGACLSESIKNPQLRVEAQVFTLVNDKKALDFAALAAHGQQGRFKQALNIPSDTGTPVVYNGSTTGPNYNEAGSPFQVTWSVRPEVKKVNIASVGDWCEKNVFNEDHAHGVRTLVTDPDLLSPIE